MLTVNRFSPVFKGNNDSKVDKKDSEVSDNSIKEKNQEPDSVKLSKKPESRVIKVDNPIDMAVLQKLDAIEQKQNATLKLFAVLVNGISKSEKNTPKSNEKAVSGEH